MVINLCRLKIISKKQEQEEGDKHRRVNRLPLLPKSNII
jgi:hypothetical protein